MKRSNMDNKRLQGPEDSEDYHFYDTKSVDFDIITCMKNEKRLDGRELSEQRKIYLKTGVNSRVKGSAYIEAGKTKVVVSVYEPREIPRLSEFSPNGELFCEFRIAPFARPTRRSLMIQPDEKDLGLALKRALEPAVCRDEFPNCQVDVYVLVLDDDGGAFPAAVTAAAVALADGGIPMYDTVGAITVGFWGCKNFIDPTSIEESMCSTSTVNEDCGLFTVVYLASLGQFSSLTFSGCLSSERVFGVLDLAIERCSDVAKLSRIILTDDVVRKSQEEAESSPSDGT